jgi:hypothetical protein
MMTRSEHLEYSKKRALELLNMGLTDDAYQSMISDLISHPETMNHSAIEVGAMLLFSGQLETYNQMKRFIEGFN